MAATQQAPAEADWSHRAALRELEPQRDASLYACEQLHAAGLEVAGPEVRQWLDRHGRTVGRTTIWKAVTEYRHAHGMPDLDDARGLFSEAVNTDTPATEQPAGGTPLFTLDDAETAAVPGPVVETDPGRRGSGERPHQEAISHETTEPAQDGVVNEGQGGNIEHVEPSPPAISPDVTTLTRTVRADRPLPTWPVLLMAFPAFVAIWSGWVGLGAATGFGVVHPLPGIADDFTLNSAITLPIGVEAYASYALFVWLSGRIQTKATRTYSMVSAFVSLGIGAAGQVAYHFMQARNITVAPWWIITMVACLPVVVVGMGAVLAHLIIRERHAPNV